MWLICSSAAETPSQDAWLPESWSVPGDGSCGRMFVSVKAHHRRDILRAQTRQAGRGSKMKPKAIWSDWQKTWSWGRSFRASHERPARAAGLQLNRGKAVRCLKLQPSAAKPSRAPRVRVAGEPHCRGSGDHADPAVTEAQRRWEMTIYAASGIVDAHEENRSCGPLAARSAAARRAGTRRSGLRPAASRRARCMPAPRVGVQIFGHQYAASYRPAASGRRAC